MTDKELDDTYHMTLGQWLAAIAEKEMDKAENVKDLIKIIAKLRQNLLSESIPPSANE